MARSSGSYKLDEVSTALRSLFPKSLPSSDARSAGVHVVDTYAAEAEADA